MKLFLSWSGSISKKLAEILRDWIPSVIQEVEPFMSSEDIEKGVRWNMDLIKQLEELTIGIICLTPENLNAPWLNFEAGALAKVIDKSYVCPVLFKLKPVEIKGPLTQFQLTNCEKEDIKKLLKTINTTCGEKKLEEKRLDNAFEVWWQNLKTQLDELGIKADKKFKSDEKPNNKEHSKELLNEMVEEILERIRSQEDVLRNPDKLLPRDYLRFALEDFGFKGDKRTEMYFRNMLTRMSQYLRKYEKEKSIPNEELREILHNMERIFDMIRK